MVPREPLGQFGRAAQGDARGSAAFDHDDQNGVANGGSEPQVPGART
jgi:hypothetical protein